MNEIGERSGLIYTEQGVHFDGLDSVECREQGTRGILDQLRTYLSIERERAPDEHFAGCDRGRTIRILKQSVRTEPRCPFETDLATRRFT